MRLLVVRHGEAEALRTQDAERRLTATGRQQVVDLAARLLPSWAGQRLISSPYQRARETAGILAAALGGDTEIWDEITPEGAVRACVERLQSRHEDLILVTHMHFLSDLCAYLVDGCLRSDEYPLATASARVLSAQLWLPGAAQVMTGLAR